MEEEEGGDLVLLIGNVDLQLVRTVGVEVAGVAPQLDRVEAGEVPQLPLVGRAPFLDVVHMAQSLQVLVRLAVELEVGFQVGLVVAQLAEGVAANDDGYFILPRPAAVLGEML